MDKFVDGVSYFHLDFNSDMKKISNFFSPRKLSPGLDFLTANNSISADADNGWKTKSLLSDFYTEQVLPGDSIRFENVNISPSEPIRIDVHTTGINGNALPHYMVGIDRFEVKKWPRNRSRE
jgi:hypothetical protein